MQLPLRLQCMSRFDTASTWDNVSHTCSWSKSPSMSTWKSTYKFILFEDWLVLSDTICRLGTRLIHQVLSDITILYIRKLYLSGESLLVILILQKNIFF